MTHSAKEARKQKEQGERSEKILKHGEGVSNLGGLHKLGS